jgi:hypothetical protein
VEHILSACQKDLGMSSQESGQVAHRFYPAA